MAWHLGYPLSQTLFTSVYIENMLQPTPETIEAADFIRDPTPGSRRDPMHGALRAYCLGLLKACGHVNDRIKYEHSYEVRHRPSPPDLTNTEPPQGRRLCHQHVQPVTPGDD